VAEVQNLSVRCVFSCRYHERNKEVQNNCFIAYIKHSFDLNSEDDV
jgi:hypothetical protein